MIESHTLYVAWQNPDSRRWFPIARLHKETGHYSFCYLRGAEQAGGSGFSALIPFPDLHKTYESNELFPLFQNRLLPRSRPDYEQHMSRLDLSPEQNDPLVILGRNGGRRVTDSLEVFPAPFRSPEGRYRVHFFAHGLRHLPPESTTTVSTLQRMERLLLCYDVQNPTDSNAILLRTQAGQLVGWTPRYLCHDLKEVCDRYDHEPIVSVVRVNPHPAPLGQRLLCKLDANWPDGFMPFSTPEYESLAR